LPQRDLAESGRCASSWFSLDQSNAAVVVAAIPPVRSVTVNARALLRLANNRRSALSLIVPPQRPAGVTPPGRHPCQDLEPLVDGLHGVDVAAPVRHCVADARSVGDRLKHQRLDHLSVVAARLIAPDAVFMESGKIESRAEYEMNHLPADIEFETHVKPVRGPLRITFDGRDTAWVISHAEYDEGNPVKYIITQLMVLTRDTGDWRIRTISWSANQP
jgi:hypothetical protein